MIPQRAPIQACFGVDRGRGNLLGVQPTLSNWDYRGRLELTAALNTVLAVADSQRWLTEKTVVVLPEHIGTFLYLADEWPWVYESLNTRLAGLRMLWSRKSSAATRWLMYLLTLNFSGLRQRLLVSKAKEVAEHYTESFGSLATFFGVTIVAGSVALPNPRVVHGRLEAKPGGAEMCSVGAVFRPDGAAEPFLYEKLHPTGFDSAHLGVLNGSGGMEAYDSPIGRFAVALGADSLYGDQDLEGGLDALVVPSFLPAGGRWHRKWSGAPEVPPDEGETRRGRMTERAAWLKLGPPAMARRLGASKSLCVFLRGPLWEFGTMGQPIVDVGQGAQEVEGDGDILVNVWM